MSVRINYDGLAGAGSTGASRTDELSRAGGANTNKKSGGVGGAGEDSVEISSLAGLVAAAGDQVDTQRAGRVQQLAAQYQSGQYQVDSKQVSKAIVANAIAESQ